MSLPRVVSENVLRLKKAYIDYRSTREGLEFEKERREHEENVKKILSREALDKLNESTLLLLADNIYAFMWWTRKEYLVDYWIKGAGGLDRLRHHLKELLYSDRSLPERFDTFRRNVKGIGVAMITEMLTYFNPEEYGIWNRRVKEALISLGMEDVSKISLNKLTGQEYASIIKTLKEIASLLRDPEKLSNPDLLDVHYFLYYVLTVAREEEHVVEEAYEHDEIINMLLNIGKGLGFDVSSEVPIVTGTKIDVVWLAKIGNLGELKYVFEVQIKGSMDSLLINLVRASQDPTVQKVVAVANEEELEKIKNESSTLKILSDKLVFWSIKEVTRANNLIEELMEITQRLGLTKL